MNIWQVCKQIRYALLARTWGGSGSVVFGSGSVVISQGVSDQIKKTGIRPPMAIISPQGGQVDPAYGEEPSVIQRDIRITLLVVIPGDHVGQNSLIGANVPDTTKSEGRGVLEVEEELLAAVEYVGTDTGVVIEFKSSAAGVPTIDPDLGYIVAADYLFTAWCTNARYYHPCENLVATGGSGQVVLTWDLPPDRYDRYRVVLRRATGATAPTSITGGTGVTLASDLATSVTDSGLAANDYSYALFATYDELDGQPDGTPDTDQRVSAALTRTSVTVS